MAIDSRRLAADVQQFVVEFRRDLHRHPEASFQEFRTTGRIAQELDRIGIPYQRLEPTGVIGTIQGGAPGKTVALRADIDALSITERSGVEFASENPGFMHACGHDTHTAMLLGAAKALFSARDQLAGTVKVLFQPAEEVGIGAKAVLRQGVLEGVDMIFGLHIFSCTPVGTLGICEGAAMSAADRFHIRVRGKACHGAMPETGVDATVAAAALVLNLQSMVSREIDPQSPVVVTVGSLHSGTRFNIVSGEAELEGTVRCFDRKIHGELPVIMERIATHTAEAYRCTAKVDYQQLMDVLVCDSEASALCRAAACKAADSPALVSSAPRVMGAEDFADYTARLKGGFVALGGGGTYPMHSDRIVFDEAAFPTGVAFLIQVAADFLNTSAKGQAEPPR